jgi:hypothetical protein
MNRKGLLIKDQEQFLAEVLFHFANVQSRFTRFISLWVVLSLIQGIDNFVLDRLNPYLKARLIPIIDAAMAGQTNYVQRLAADWAAESAKIKYTSLDRRMEFADSIGRTIVTGIALYSEYYEGKKFAA